VKTRAVFVRVEYLGRIAPIQIGQLGGQAIIPTIREAVFDCDIAAFGIANVTKATAD
jgi:hypothetical protein